MMKSKVQSQNKVWGFYGTTQTNYGIADSVMDQVYDAAAKALTNMLGVSIDEARVFLDSKYGRHFSDELSFHGAKAGVSEPKLVEIIEETIEEAHWVKKSQVFNEVRAS